MCAQMYIPSTVNLTEFEYLLVREYADQHSLGEKGFSSAIRLIINEWRQLSTPHPEHSPAHENATCYQLGDATRRTGIDAAGHQTHKRLGP